MSVLPQAPPTTTRNGHSDHETFQKFFEWWLVEQNQDLQNLIDASKHHEHIAHETRSTRSDEYDDSSLRSLVDRVIKHYENYYRAKSTWANHDVLSMLTPSWRSSLEDAFLWIGGWRPSMAFHLLYSKSGLQLEAQLNELISGMSTGDLGDLSPCQLSEVNELHMKTIREEKVITEKLAKHQETVADTSMVDLAHAVTELIREGEVGQIGGHEVERRVESTLAPKEEGLKEILKRADDLRLTTLKNILAILTPIQAVHFLIAAAALHLRIHEWGKRGH